MEYKNKMELKFTALSENESFARLAVASFCSNQKLTYEDISDIKTAVSEAVTNCIVHGYENSLGDIYIVTTIYDGYIEILVEDNGVGIENINEAIQPFYSTKKHLERSGMGFNVMEGFMDKMEVSSKLGEGTSVRLIKNLKS